jgi:hypothetical protein
VSNKWLWLAGGVALGYFIAPKLRNWLPSGIPQARG